MEEYQNKTYYDIRYDAYYTITRVYKKETATFFTMEYEAKPHLNREENSDFVLYHINAGQHLLKIQ